MTPFRFIHTSDLHLGRRFGNMPEDVRGGLVDARHDVIGRIAAVASAHGAGHVLVAGDVFDTGTPSDRVRRQALSAMGEDPTISWWLMPGNHDSLAAESLWEQVVREAPANVRPVLDTAPLALADGVALLPAPATRRYPGRDLTAHMPSLTTADGDLRIGLAHGAVVDFSEDGDPETIPPDRDRTAGLDYLALGDWHGQRRISDRVHYSGTPEQDRFRHNERGACLIVTIDGPGALPRVQRVEIGRFLWADVALPLLPGQDAAAALASALPGAGRRDTLVRVHAEGRARLPERDALVQAAEHLAPEFWHFELDDSGLATEIEASDLDAIDRGGALRMAAAELHAEAAGYALPAAEREIAAAALNRLYAYVREAAQ